MENKKLHLKAVVFTFIITVITYFLINHIYIIYNNTENLKLIEKVNTEAVSANILVVSIMEQIITEHDCECYCYTVAVTVNEQSGVIYKKENGRYYALTALHGIFLESDIFVLGHEQIFHTDYSQLPQAVLEYYNADYDLAVVSFYSENDYTVLSIAQKPPKYNMRVAAIGNPHDSRNIITAGKIISRKPVPFESLDLKILHNVAEHTAKVLHGNSGGALLNKNLEIIGINIGSVICDLHEFRAGLAMPSDKILEFLEGAN